MRPFVSIPSSGLPEVLRAWFWLSEGQTEKAIDELDRYHSR